MAGSKPSHLDPSELGTKEYWDALYTAELSNHAADPSDEGTVWFDDSDAEAKLLAFLESASAPPSDDDFPPLSKATTAFLDLGTGNASLPLALRAAGWRGRCLGVDYSAESVALARRVAAARGLAVELERWDVLHGPLSAVLDGQQAAGWDVVLDKGTFDAVSLSAEAGTGACEAYGARVARLLRHGGVFLVTSCNWTEAELAAWFEGARADPAGEEEGEKPGRLRRVGSIKYPSFRFGGVQGQTISTLCFVKSS